MSSEMHLRVVTPERTVIDRKVRSVEFMGIDGSYGILPNHAPLMTGTVPGIVTIRHTDGQHEQIVITSGFAEVRNNVLSLICQAGERAQDIDVARAKAAEQRARDRLDHAAEKAVVLPRAQDALQRAMLRQLLAKRGGTGDIR
jgi:F-type H+-transporting ATPase subunit epsilon